MSPSDALLPADVAALRAALEQRLMTLAGEIEADREKVHRGTAGEQGDVLDRKDRAHRFARAGIDDAEWARDLGEANEVRAALARISVGGYGRCVDCGEAIARERLFAWPAAARCAACQGSAEQRREVR